LRGISLRLLGGKERGEAEKSEKGKG
jgi:hypothetical protein